MIFVLKSIKKYHNDTLKNYFEILSSASNDVKKLQFISENNYYEVFDVLVLLQTLIGSITSSGVIIFFIDKSYLLGLNFKDI